MAMTRCGRLKHIFASDLISHSLKIRLYKAAVCSIFTYGCETWDLSEATMRKLNGANSKMLSHITGRGIRTEARPQTTSLNLVREIRIRRFRWLGHILRSPSDRLIQAALMVQLHARSPGNLFLDAPAFDNIDDLVVMAKDRAAWQVHIANIPFDGSIPRNQMHRTTKATRVCNRTKCPTTKTTSKTSFHLNIPASTCKPLTNAEKYRIRDAKAMLISGKTRHCFKTKKKKQRGMLDKEKKLFWAAKEANLDIDPRLMTNSEKRKCWDEIAKKNATSTSSKTTPSTSTRTPQRSVRTTSKAAMLAVFSSDDEDSTINSGFDSFHSAIHENDRSLLDFMPRCDRPPLPDRTTPPSVPITTQSPPQPPTTRTSAPAATYYEDYTTTASDHDLQCSPLPQPTTTNTYHIDDNKRLSPLNPQTATASKTTKSIWERFGRFRRHHHNKPQRPSNTTNHGTTKQSNTPTPNQIHGLPQLQQLSGR